MNILIKVPVVLSLLMSVYGFNSDLINPPITGTFVLFDYGFNPASWNPYFEEILDLGMNTVVITGIASIGGCPDNIIISPFFDNGLLNRFLESAYDHDFSVYVGLTWAHVCVSNDKIIDLSLLNASKIKALTVGRGWGWEDNFIEGFYIPTEVPIYAMGGSDIWEKSIDLYIQLSDDLKSLYPSKKIMISPYKFEWMPAWSIYNDVLEFLSRASIDVLAVQDSIGAGLVTSFERDREQYRALADAVRDSNLALGKSVKAWANIETMKPAPNNDLFWKSQPTDIDTLSLQIEATDGFVEKRITWIYQWSMAQIPLPDTAHYSDYEDERLQLRNDYMNKYGLSPQFKKMLEMIR